MLLRFQPPKNLRNSVKTSTSSPSNSVLWHRVRVNTDRFQVLALENPEAAEYLLRWTEEFLDHTVGPAINAPKSSR